jgi:ATP-binding cassette subfamily C (CFTR/MRP) protein 2
MSFGFLAFFRAYLVWHGVVKTSRVIHRKMMISLLYAPITEFFERIPLGRILNRVSKDIATLDLDIGLKIGSNLVNIFSFIADIVVLVFTSSPYVLLAIFVLVLIAKQISNSFQKAQRELIRLGILNRLILESISKSPILSHFTEVLNGLPTIRTFGC